ncbi:Glycogen debranching enzyme [Streptomyces antimycoticus]
MAVGCLPFEEVLLKGRMGQASWERMQGRSGSVRCLGCSRPPEKKWKSRRMQVWPGQAYPLGATYDGAGTNFAVFSEAAVRIELCLLHDDGSETAVELRESDAFVRHAYLPGIMPGQRYGFRAHGPYEPESGHRCNSAKLLLDPYAKAISGRIGWGEEVYGYHFGRPDKRNDLDSAPHTMASVVVNPYFDWGDDRPPRTDYHRTVIYEAHVKGLTMRHPRLPEELRGTYAALAHPAIIEHLTELGVTTLELMPVHQFVHDHRLAKTAGLANYWGYNTIGFFAPHNAYASWGDRGQQVAGVQIGRPGAAPGGHRGHPGRGLQPHGRGQSSGPHALLPGPGQRLVLPADRGPPVLHGHHRHRELPADALAARTAADHGLAALLGDRDACGRLPLRSGGDAGPAVPRGGPAVVVLRSGPAGSGGESGEADRRTLGRRRGRLSGRQLPPLWTEWNGKFRDTVRDLWRGEPRTLAEFASRLTGSSDLYQGDGRRPLASVNFVTCHDGFTLRDLVSYDEKHNEANGESNQDGESYNRSWNCGVEGETDDPAVRTLRERQMRNFVATLMLSQGVPMLSHGDEFGRTQGGNNNAYCQDNEVSWVRWPDHVKGQDGEWEDRSALELLRFTRSLVWLRRDHPVFRRRRFFHGRPVEGTHDELSDIAWFTHEGEEMIPRDWQAAHAKSLAVFLNGSAISEPGVRGERITDDSFLLLFNAHHEPLDFVVPIDHGKQWQVIVDTAVPEGVEPGSGAKVAAGDVLTLVDRSLMVLQRPA